VPAFGTATSAKRTTNPSISGNGSIVAYQSNATNLRPTQDLNTFTDVYIYSAADSDTLLVSYGYNGDTPNGNSQTPAISRDGGSIAFASDATNMVQVDDNGKRDIFVGRPIGSDIVRGSVATGGVQADGGSHNAALSSDGRYLVFDSTATNLGSDGNATADVFIRDNGAS
jgi:Tol biopolymer transport system component